MIPIYTEECPEGMLELITEVRADQTDAQGRMCLGDLARQMQILTEQHFDRFSGCTIHTLNEEGLSWIIAWSEMQIIRMPVRGEKIRMRVWAGKKKAVLHTRKYAFYTMDGSPLAAVSSLFLLMDRVTRQAAADPAAMKQAICLQVPNEPNAPKMTVRFPEAFANTGKRVVSPEEIDYNGHLNNSYYLDWSEELPDADYRSYHIPRNVWIEYTKELMEGDTVTLDYECRNDILYVTGSHNGISSFRVKAEYDVDASEENDIRAAI